MTAVEDTEGFAAEFGPIRITNVALGTEPTKKLYGTMNVVWSGGLVRSEASPAWKPWWNGLSTTDSLSKYDCGSKGGDLLS
mmetsp:Transcript_11294/g.23119  ORF Transcript_11294/g.23119 Transcript_11294/m.23119 type:complete len:81 (+) Transcript_11294:133-375(+)|eukprot:CAMPEP_0172458624 /NCGR_PEP_ID=MMETSP1065-20121228/28438_1 /TAXON_ID=265537 /ORGANISM="Amphiprora paludosa, Strain CCMP125" /LENGTH=80 /DNA_ID=CAMNT_0013212969 /DNA_START=55 /DNA_END=297 /DNA_ORIENTATION=-